MFFVLGHDHPRCDNHMRSLCSRCHLTHQTKIYLKANIPLTRTFLYSMAWWISFTLIQTKAILLNQNKKGSCMCQSQDATFTALMGEENLMNINHRDSESITGESSLINEVLLPIWQNAFKAHHDETQPLSPALHSSSENIPPCLGKKSSRQENLISSSSFRTASGTDAHPPPPT